jgi:class 3 adenylate cyclase
MVLDRFGALRTLKTHYVCGLCDVSGDTLEEIDRFNGEHGRPGIILKIGVHCGPSIAVTLNDNLDYFGQIVNVAARVQSLAEAGQICISEALYAAPGVTELLAGREVVAFEAPLRGVGEGDAAVYRILPTARRRMDRPE